MCVEIRYIFPYCHCFVRIGKYTCFHASDIAATGYATHCPRYKKTVQEMRTGKMACREHIKEAERMAARRAARTSEETLGERLMLVDRDTQGGMRDAGDGGRDGEGEGSDGDFGDVLDADGDSDMGVVQGEVCLDKKGNGKIDAR